MKKKRLSESLHSSSPLFSAPVFLERFSSRGVFLFLSLLLVLGVVAGSVIASNLGLFEGRSVFPLYFSGIPSPKAGFLSCFSTLLLNVLICLILLFLLGVTAFGVFAVPLFVLLKGVAVGMGVCSFLWMDGLPGFGCSALIYTPAAAAASLLLLFFASRALVFSDRMAKVSFSAQEGSLDFGDYFKDFLLFLCFAVAASLAGSLPAVLYAVFLP